MGLESGRYESVPRITAESADINIEDPLAQEALKQLQFVIDMPESKIDFGGRGIVYRLANGVCMKVLDNRHESEHYDQGNTLAEEARFNQYLSNVAVRGVRSPHYIGRINARHPVRMQVILMEELPAVNLQRALRREAAMPQSFDIDSFMRGFSTYMTHLNEDIGVFHNDLEPRNVMVDIQTGAARVIDFGRSKWSNTLREDERKRLAKKDWDGVVAIESAIEKYLESLTVSR